MLEVIDKLGECRPLYKEMDELIAQLLKTRRKTFQYGKKIITLVDNYKDKNTSFKALGIRRFDIIVSDAP